MSLVTGLTLLRKVDNEVWKRLKGKLEKHYLNSRGCKPSAHRMFLTRCRNYKEIRDIGLQYVVFCPTLTVWADNLKVKEWQLRKNQILESQVLLQIAKAINHHCEDWYEVLTKAYPRQLVPLSHGQFHRMDVDVDVSEPVESESDKDESVVAMGGVDSESVNSPREDGNMEYQEWMDWDGLGMGGLFSEEEELESEVESPVAWDGERDPSPKGKIVNEVTDESEKLRSPQIDVDLEDFEKVDGGEDEPPPFPPGKRRNVRFGKPKGKMVGERRKLRMMEAIRGTYGRGGISSHLRQKLDRFKKRKSRQHFRRDMRATDLREEIEFENVGHEVEPAAGSLSPYGPLTVTASCSSREEVGSGAASSWLEYPKDEGELEVAEVEPGTMEPDRTTVQVDVAGTGNQSQLAEPTEGTVQDDIGNDADSWEGIDREGFDSEGVPAENMSGSEKGEAGSDVESLREKRKHVQSDKQVETRRTGTSRSPVRRDASDNRSRSPKRRDDTPEKTEPSSRRRSSRERSPLRRTDSVSRLHDSLRRGDRSPRRRYRAEVAASDIAQGEWESEMEELLSKGEEVGQNGIEAQVEEVRGDSRDESQEFMERYVLEDTGEDVELSDELSEQQDGDTVDSKGLTLETEMQSSGAKSTSKGTDGVRQEEFDEQRDPIIIELPEVERCPGENREYLSQANLKNFDNSGRRRKSISKGKETTFRLSVGHLKRPQRPQKVLIGEKRKFGQVICDNERGPLKRQRVSPPPQVSIEERVAGVIIAESGTPESIIAPDRESDGTEPGPMCILIEGKGARDTYPRSPSRDVMSPDNLFARTRTPLEEDM